MSRPMAESLVARVERLERENRRSKRLLLGAAVIAVAGLVLAPGAPKKEPPKVLKTREVQIVDDQGTVRMALKIEANGAPVLSLAGTKGSGMRLALVEDRPVLELSDETRVRATLGIDKDGAGLDLQDSEAKRTVRLQAGAALGLLVDDGKSPGAGAALVVGDGEPSLTLSAPDDVGPAAVSLQVSPETGPLVAASRGLAAARLDVSRDADPSVTVSDAKGRDRAVLGVTKLEVEKKKRGKQIEKQRTEPSSLVLFDPEETVIWRAP